MRISCLECVRKHLGEAEIAIEESFSGYPHHMMWAVGSFSHAASEALKAYPELAHTIRETRLAFERCHVRVIAGESLQDVAQDLPDMDELAQRVNEMIVEEILQSKTGQTETSKHKRSIMDALNITEERKEQE